MDFIINYILEWIATGCHVKDCQRKYFHNDAKCHKPLEPHCLELKDKIWRNYFENGGLYVHLPLCDVWHDMNCILWRTLCIQVAFICERKIYFMKGSALVFWIDEMNCSVLTFNEILDLMLDDGYLVWIDYRSYNLMYYKIMYYVYE
jgi:hypothetical protein